MLQNAGALQDPQSTVKALEWLAENAPRGSLLLARYVLTGWAQLCPAAVEIQTFFSMSGMNLR